MVGSPIEMIHGDLLSVFPCISRGRKLKDFAAFKLICAQHLPLRMLVKEAFDSSLPHHDSEVLVFDLSAFRVPVVPDRLVGAPQVISAISNPRNILCDKCYAMLVLFWPGVEYFERRVFVRVIDQRPVLPPGRQTECELD